MGIEDIYTELIAEESKSTEHRRHLDAPTAVMKGRNPSCGDEITLELAVKNGVVEDAAFTGVGCAISQASTSLMIGLVKGQTTERAKALVETFLAMIRGEIPEGDPVLDTLGDAAALQGVSILPARVKCAALSWSTLAIILEGEGAAVSTGAGEII